MTHYSTRFISITLSVGDKEMMRYIWRWLTAVLTGRMCVGGAKNVLTISANVLCIVLGSVHIERRGNVPIAFVTTQAHTLYYKWILTNDVVFDFLLMQPCSLDKITVADYDENYVTNKPILSIFNKILRQRHNLHKRNNRFPGFRLVSMCNRHSVQ